MYINPEEAQAVSAKQAIKDGDTKTLTVLLDANPELATAYIGSDREARTLLHVATDWPGNLPNVVSTIETLVTAGADVNAPFVGPMHKETPLHFAASSDDTLALGALLDAGADIEASGGVIAGGTPLTDATAFRQWRAARMLLQRGAKPTLNSAAALGLMDHLQAALGDDKPFHEGEAALQQQLDYAFWYACHGGQLEAARFLHQRGADSKIIPPWSEGKTVLDVAKENEASGAATYSELVAWLHSIGLMTMKE
jgi:hypothetical protein